MVAGGLKKGKIKFTLFGGSKKKRPCLPRAFFPFDQQYQTFANKKIR
jgi:hypothetical protein